MQKIIVKPIRLAIIIVLVAMACGSLDRNGQGAIPIVVRLDPETVTAGETMTIYGSGFSEAESNLVLIAGIVVVNTDWDVADTGQDGEEEQLVFTVPDTVPSGTQEVVVMVGNETTNSLSVTVE